VRNEQGSANELLAAAIAELEETDLRGRLAALAANAAHEEPAADPLSDGPPESDPLEGDAP